MKTLHKKAAKAKQDLLNLFQAEVAAFLTKHPRYVGITWDQSHLIDLQGAPSTFFVGLIYFIEANGTHTHFGKDEPVDEAVFVASFDRDPDLFLWLFGDEKTVKVTVDTLTTEKLSLYGD